MKPTETQNEPLETQNEPPEVSFETLDETLRVSFSLNDIAAAVRVSSQAFRRTWWPALVKVAPTSQLRIGQKYSKRAMELALGLYAAKRDGVSVDTWVRNQNGRIKEAVSRASEAGAIVPVEVVEVTANQAQSLVVAQSQAHLAFSLVDAVITGLQGQHQAQLDQSARIHADQVRTRAALEYAAELQIRAQVRADMDAAILANSQAQLAQQLQQFQGGES